jgi:hypothetical protein
LTTFFWRCKTVKLRLQMIDGVECYLGQRSNNKTYVNWPNESR